MLNHVTAGVLSVAFEESGTDGDIPVVLLHGFPYDIHAYDEVTHFLVEANCHVYTPYLRGYGSTRFLSPNTLRSGQQAALAQDLAAFMDALDIRKAVLAGYDWGGRAACITSALWPERVRGLVLGGGYSIQNIAASVNPQPPEDEFRYWYQYYFHGERGQAGLSQNRHELCKLLWKLWSPNWHFDDATFEQTAGSFNNPDFVDVVIHSYRHRFGLVDGDPALENIERQLTALPKVAVPTVVIEGGVDGVAPPVEDSNDSQFFTGAYQHRIFATAGHNLPQEEPRDFALAVLSVT
ncbi:MAG: alpha/beta fold hydrolase [Anaerolineaceae bacterium]|nr:alpha/beta fold hydrolase [Anaerolineaceae bacterium]